MRAESSLARLAPPCGSRKGRGLSSLLRLCLAGGPGGFVASTWFTWVKLLPFQCCCLSPLVLARVAHTRTHQLLGVSQCLPTARHAVGVVQVEVSAPALRPAATSASKISGKMPLSQQSCLWPGPRQGALPRCAGSLGRAVEGGERAVGVEVQPCELQMSQPPVPAERRVSPEPGRCWLVPQTVPGAVDQAESLAQPERLGSSGSNILWQKGGNM